MTKPDLDRFDRKLLDAVQRNADVTAEELACQVGLSSSAVQRRLRRLKVQGVIEATVAVIDPLAVGRTSFFVVGLQFEREKHDLLARLRGWLIAEPAVQQAYYVTGEWDFVLIVAARGIQEYDAMMARLLAENPVIRRFTTHVALAVPKRSLAVPVLAGGHEQ